MSGAASRARLPGGRWHFHHGPIDLVIGADGDPAQVALAVDAGWTRFAGLLAELAGELPLLRAPCAASTAAQPAPPDNAARGPVARRMVDACLPFARRFGSFVTPMAAVAGAVAHEIAVCFARPGVRRAWVNNGGDVALWLADGASVEVGMVDDPALAALAGRLRIDADAAPRGIATSGWRGRSFSFGVADAVTVLARTAAQADAAATLIADEVDVDHPLVRRAPACRLRDDTDLGERLVTVAVPCLPADAIDAALGRGERFARRCAAAGLIEQARLSVQGRSRIVAAHRIEAIA